ncbi:MAG: hypothetical protein ACE5KL_08135 [Alphaproteobacteria bacterium]
MRGRPTLAALSVLAVIAAAPVRAEDPDFLAVQAGVFEPLPSPAGEQTVRP